MKNLLAIAKEAALKAGEAILEVYNTDDFGVDFKGDSSPLTKADKKGHEVIVSFLEKTNLPILSEEGVSIPFEERKNWKRYWCVDPLDGTKEFIKRNGEFTVNIALIENGVPILGVVSVPVLGKLFYGMKGEGAWLEIDSNKKILDPKTTPSDLVEIKKHDGLRIVASRSHLSKETQDFIDELSNPSTVSMGSSLKFLVLAQGDADIYPRFAPTMEWDTAAAHGVLLGLGYQVFRYPSLEPLVYNKENLLNPYFIVF
jgi:3'(2'), 5'-bisphosphate nucleotidase